MSELNRSLTAMDWLPRLNAKGALSAGGTAWLDSGYPEITECVAADSSTPSSPPRDGKPPYSYANLISFAISSTSKGKMTLSEIYQWIMDNFPYYKMATTGWKNSVRHNLSLNKCFTKVARTKEDPGKGSYWAIDINSSHEKSFSKKKKNAFPRFEPYVSSSTQFYSQNNKNTSVLHGSPSMISNVSSSQVNASPIQKTSSGSSDSLNLVGLNPQSLFPIISQPSPVTSLNIDENSRIAASQIENNKQFVPTWNSTVTTLDANDIQSLNNWSSSTEVVYETKVPYENWTHDDKISQKYPTIDITINDGDFALLNDLTHEQLEEYLLNTSTIPIQQTDNMEFYAHPNQQLSFHEVSLSLIPSSKLLHPTSSQTSETLDSFTTDPLLAGNPKSTNSLSASLVREPQYSPFSISSPASNISTDEGIHVPALSEHLSASHGSGGIVTIRKKAPPPDCSSLKNSLSEPLVRLLENLSPPTSSTADFDTNSVSQICAGSQSDDEEINDDFNWDKLL